MGTSFGQIGTAPTEGEKKETANDWMAQIRSEQKDKQDTLAYWDGRIRVHPQEAGHYFERGRLRAQLAKDDDRAGLDAAIADFSRAVELEPKHAEALCQRGFLAWRKKELDAALADFCRVIELVPDHSTALIARGQVYLAMEDFDRAITDFDRAAAIRPGEKDSPTLIGRAQCFAAKGEYRRAIDDLSAVMAKLDVEPWVYQQRASYYLELGETARAMADIDVVLRLQPDEPLARFLRVTLLMQKGRYDIAPGSGETPTATHGPPVSLFLAFPVGMDGCRRAGPKPGPDRAVRSDHGADRTLRPWSASRPCRGSQPDWHRP